MLPFIIAVAGGAIFVKLKEKCSQCNSPWTINSDCTYCKKNVCGGCAMPIHEELYHGLPVIQAGQYCKSHSKDIQTKVSLVKAEIDTALKVITYSKNFKGKTESPKFSKTIETKYHRDKSVAELELKMLAMKKNCNFILNVEFLRDEHSSGNYKYSVWKAKGVI